MQNGRPIKHRIMPQNTGGITDFVNSVELVEWE